MKYSTTWRAPSSSTARLLSSRFTAASLAGLKGVIYTDAGEPPADVRKQVLDFVNAGGMLITGAAWGSIPKGSATGSHPRFAIRPVGKGAIAVATTAFSDPYIVPNDAVMMVSHRNDVVRYFNGGAITPCLYRSADKRRASLAHGVLFAAAGGGCVGLGEGLMAFRTPSDLEPASSRKTLNLKFAMRG